MRSDHSDAARIGIIGSGGRLGQALMTACRQAGIPVVAELTRTGLTKTACPTVVFDVSSPEVIARTVSLADQWGAALIYCVSVVPPDSRERLDRLAERLPVLLATNLSAGHWLQTRLTAHLAALLDRSQLAATAVVGERHPRTKRDRPSASAVALADTWQTHLAAPVEEIISLRYGPMVSDHRVRLDLTGESLSIGHEVTDLSAAAAGALLLAAHTPNLAAGLVSAEELFDSILGGRSR